MLEAKMNASANAVDVLQRNGVVEARENELRTERREANWKRQHGEGPPEIPRYDKRMFAVQKNAAAKLRVLYRDVDFMELRETRIRNTDLKAFVVAFIVEGRRYVGVGKTKKEARCEAAEQALRHLKLWTDADEDNKRMMLYGIGSKEDPEELVMRLRVKAGLTPHAKDLNVPARHPPQAKKSDFPARQPPYSKEWDMTDDVTSSADNDHLSGSWDDGGQQMFNSRGPPPTLMRGPGPRPTTFPVRGSFDNSNRGPRPFPPRPFGRGYNGERPNLIGPDKPDKERFDQSYDGMRPSHPGFGRGFDTGSRGRGNTTMMQGISRGQAIPPPPPPNLTGSDKPDKECFDRSYDTGSSRRGFGRGYDTYDTGSRGRRNTTVMQGISRGQTIAPPPPPQSNPDNTVTAAKKMLLPTPGTEKINRFGLPSKEPIQPWSHSAYQANVKRVAQNPKVGTAPGSAGDNNLAGQWQFSANTSPAGSQWNAMPYGQQQANTTFSAQNYPNTTNNYRNTSTAPEQYNTNTAWQGTAQADYLAYYNSYMQNAGVSDTMPASQPSNNSFPPSGAVQSDTDYASQAMAYASYYNAFYGGATAAAGAAGFSDPNQSQMYNYMYPYNNNQPT